MAGCLCCPAGTAALALREGKRGLAAGSFHTVAMRPDGAVWGWGRNNLGQVGDGTTADRPMPVNVMVQEGT
ncbi:RCC1 domain-containing protein [Corallococcus macrosporus]